MYDGNPNLRGQFENVEYTQQNIEEYIKCRNDFFYFCENYAFIISDGKRVPCILRDYQRDLVNSMHNDKMIIAMWPRRSGKSTVVSAYIAWLTLFNDNHNTLIAAHEHKTAKEIASMVKGIIENLPLWLQQGVVKWNELYIELENGSRVFSSATTKSTGRGFAFHFCLLDEYSFVSPNIAKDFFTSIYPTIKGLTNGRMAIISTPSGYNFFYEMCEKAKAGLSNFKYSEIKWTDVPGRDEKFKKETIADIGEARFEQEFECKLSGGESNLISPKILGDIPYIHPIRSNEYLKIFEEPISDHNYMITVDTSRGKGVDASAFIVFDITSYPIKIVAHYSDSKIAPLLFPGVINNLGLYYNDASVLVEINDNGQQVADILFEEYEYPSLLGCVVKGRIGQVLTNFGSKSKGIKTSVATKRVGCSNLKAMVENYKLILNSFDIIKELSNFVEDGQSFSAQNGNHDDLVMCMVIFCWATQQQFFKQYVEKGNKEIYAEELEYLDEMSMPMPIVDDGHEVF